jgi:hypothetical protein
MDKSTKVTTEENIGNFTIEIVKEWKSDKYQ